LSVQDVAYALRSVLERLLDMTLPRSAAISQDPQTTTDPERALETMHEYKSSESACGANVYMRMGSVKSGLAAPSLQQEEDILDNH
jgi:hypothetical protein